MVCFKSYRFPPSGFGLRQRLSELSKRQIFQGKYFVDLLKYNPMFKIGGDHWKYWGTTKLDP